MPTLVDTEDKGDLVYILTMERNQKLNEEQGSTRKIWGQDTQWALAISHFGTSIYFTTP